MGWGAACGLFGELGAAATVTLQPHCSRPLRTLGARRAGLHRPASPDACCVSPTCAPRYYDGVAVGAVPSLNGTIPPAWENATGWYSIDKSAYPHTPFDQPFYLLLNMALGGS